MIVVLGSTGTIGSHLATRLGEAGLPARAVVRPGAGDRVSLTSVEADLTNAKSLERVFDGARDLFLLTPHAPDQDAMEHNALEAAQRVGVERIVKISGGGPSLGPNGVTATAIAHWRSEQRIEASGLKFQFLRPSFLMQNLLNIAPKMGVLAAPFGRGPIAMVDARDVADCAVSLFAHDDAPNGAWSLTGPAGVTFSDVAREWGARYLAIPPRIARRALVRRGVSPFEVDHSIRMANYFASGADGSPSTGVADLTGRSARSIRTFLEDQKQVKGG